VKISWAWVSHTPYCSWL